jgi:metal-sulfur cluster biosynthetic enzyme
LLTEDTIREALRDCYDPELALNIIDLGLVYSIAVTDDSDAPGLTAKQKVSICLTLTKPNCPDHSQIAAHIQNRLAGLPGISQTNVQIIWEPKWTPDRITAAGRKQLGI